MITVEDVERAARTIAGRVHRTPLLRNATISEQLGADVHIGDRVRDQEAQQAKLQQQQADAALEAAKNPPPDDGKGKPSDNGGKILQLPVRHKSGPHPIPIRDVRLTPVQAKAIKRYKKYFQDLQLQALRSVRGSKATDPTNDPTQDPWDRSQAQSEAEAIGMDAVLGAGQAAYDAAAQDYGLTVSWDAQASWIATHMGKRLNLIKGIEATVLEKIRLALAEGVDAGESMEQLADRVSAVFRSAIDSQAETIARTETIQAYGSASLASYRQAGIAMVQMYDGPHDDSANCAQVNGMIVTLDEAERLMAEEHPNGTRGVAPVIDRPAVAAPEMAMHAIGPGIRVS